MKQEVWVIGDDDLDDPCETDRTLALAPNPAGVVSAAPPDTEQKSPVAAFSLSLAVWGGGQFYLGKSRPGSIYLATMVLFYAALTAMAVFPGATGRLFLERPILLVAVLIGLLVGLLVWGVRGQRLLPGRQLANHAVSGLDRSLWGLLVPAAGVPLGGDQLSVPRPITEATCMVRLMARLDRVPRVSSA
jgi:hypothetical protein